MSKLTKVDADHKFLVLKFQELYAPEREAFALRIITVEGQTVLLEFPGSGGAQLRDKLAQFLEDHPEMEEWGKAGRPVVTTN